MHPVLFLLLRVSHSTQLLSYTPLLRFALNFLSLSSLLRFFLFHPDPDPFKTPSLTMSPLLVINFMAMIIPLPPAHSPSSLTYLCDLVEQFVVFLPFLQGAQIAAHSSCQGNSAECPLECVCCLRCVWTPPWAIHTRAPLPWLPHTSFSSVYPQRSPLSLWAHHTRVSIHCFNAGSGSTTFSLWSECVFVSVFVLCEAVIRWVKRTWLSSPLCLSLLPWSLTCMPTYTLSLHSLYSTTSSLSVSTLLCIHTLLAHGVTPPPVAGCLHMAAPTPPHE